MAAHTICRIQRVIIVDMAGRAGSRRRRHMRPCEGKARHAVIKRSGIPSRRRMASRAISNRECRTGSRVHWVVRLLPCR